MYKLWFVVTLALVVGVGEAEADKVTLQKLGWTLDIPNKDPWSARVTKVGNNDNDKLSLDLRKALFDVTLVRDGAACQPGLVQVASEFAKRQANVHADKAPSWLPATWYPALVTQYTPLTHLRIACRELAGGGVLVALIESGSVVLQGLPDDKHLGPLFKAIEATLRAQNLAGKPVVSGDPVAPIADAIKAAAAAPVTITIPDLGMTFEAPRGWSYVQTELKKDAGALFPGPSIWPRMHASDVDCAHGMAPRFQRERIVPAPAGVPAGYSSIVVGETVTGSTPMQTYGLCADVSGGVLLVNVTLRGASAKESKLDSEIQTLLATLLRVALGPERPRREPKAQTEPSLGVTFTLPRAAGSWMISTFEKNTDLYSEWPQTADEAVKFTRESQPCSGTEAIAFLPPGWRGLRVETGASSGTGMAGTSYLACAPVPGGGRLVARVNAYARATARDRDVRLRALLDTIGRAAGIVTSAQAPAITTAPVAAASPTMPAPAPAPYVPTTTTYPSYYQPSTSGTYKPYRRRRLASRFELSGHQLAPSVDGIEASYGAAVGYTGTILRRGRVIPRIHGQLGYDQTSKLLVDASFALGLRKGTDIAGLSLFATVGVDAIGAGEDAVPDRAHVAANAYYGGELHVDFSSLRFSFAYYARNADDSPAERRIELWSRIGRLPLGVRYTGYDAVGRFLALATAF